MTTPRTRTRTCVVSRKRRTIDELVRLGVDDSGCLCVKRGRGGRSAWVRFNAALVRKLEAKPGMARRSLRRMPKPGTGLLDDVAKSLADRLALRLRRAWRGGSVRIPRATDPPELLRLVSWLPPGTATEHAVLPWDAPGLGGLLGRSRIATLVAIPSRTTRALQHDLRLWCELGYSPAPLAASSSALSLRPSESPI